MSSVPGAGALDLKSRRRTGRPPSQLTSVAPNASGLQMKRAELIHFLATSLLNQENDVIFFSERGNGNGDNDATHAAVCVFFFLKVSAWFGSENQLY